MPQMSRKGTPSPSNGFRRSSSEGRSGLLASLLMAVAVLMLAVYAHEGGSGVLSGTRSVFQTITSPVRMAGSAMVMPFSGLGNVMHNLTADESTLSELEQKNAELTARNAELEEAEQTATRLESLLGLGNTYNLQSTAARIISGSTDSWSRSVTIDKGTTSGLAVGMPVVGSQGAIGEITECGPATATVRLLSDENSSVAAMLQKSRAQGQVEGSVDGTLHLSMISTDQEVNVGDTVVTSGLGGVFPKGLPIGTVASATKNDDSIYYDIVVNPLSGTENYEEVLVITSLTDDQQATSDDIASADAQDSGANVTGGTSSNGSSADNASGTGGSGSSNASAGSASKANGGSNASSASASQDGSPDSGSTSANGNATTASTGVAGSGSSDGDVGGDE